MQTHNYIPPGPGRSNLPGRRIHRDNNFIFYFFYLILFCFVLFYKLLKAALIFSNADSMASMELE